MITRTHSGPSGARFISSASEETKRCEIPGDRHLPERLAQPNAEIGGSIALLRDMPEPISEAGC